MKSPPSAPAIAAAEELILWARGKSVPEGGRDDRNQVMIDAWARIIDDQFVDLREQNRQAGNLLAVMHRDGGHYISKHGWEKACKDAERVKYDLIEKLDGNTMEIATLREALKEAVAWLEKDIPKSPATLGLRPFSKEHEDAYVAYVNFANDVIRFNTILKTPSVRMVDCDQEGENRA